MVWKNIYKTKSLHIPSFEANLKSLKIKFSNTIIEILNLKDREIFFKEITYKRKEERVVVEDEMSSTFTKEMPKEKIKHFKDITIGKSIRVKKFKPVGSNILA